MSLLWALEEAVVNTWLATALPKVEATLREARHLFPHLISLWMEAVKWHPLRSLVRAQPKPPPDSHRSKPSPNLVSSLKPPPYPPPISPPSPPHIPLSPPPLPPPNKPTPPPPSLIFQQTPSVFPPNIPFSNTASPLTYFPSPLSQDPPIIIPLPTSLTPYPTPSSHLHPRRLSTTLHLSAHRFPENNQTCADSLKTG